MGGRHVCAVRSDGSLACWGANNEGQLGRPPRRTDSYEPGTVGTDNEWERVDGGHRYHSCGLQMDGSLWCWGYSYFGQGGFGGTLFRQLPERVGTETWQALSVGYNTTCGVRAEGSLWCWGSNVSGATGIGDVEVDQVNVPARVGTRTDWVDVDLGRHHGCAIAGDGSLWCWGENENGQLGKGDREDRDAPVRVGNRTDWSRLGLGEQTTCALTTDARLRCWGSNGLGELGLPSGTEVLAPPSSGRARTGLESRRATASRACFAATALSGAPAGTMWDSSGWAIGPLGTSSRRFAFRRLDRLEVWRRPRRLSPLRLSAPRRWCSLGRPMAEDGFHATVRQVYRLADSLLLVLEEDYRGDIGPGDRLDVDISGGRTVRTTVKDLAWGSAFHASNPPLTLIVDLIDGDEPGPGAIVRPVFE